jgi:peptide/nickel transport system substrate-binding protein
MKIPKLLLAISLAAFLSMGVNIWSRSTTEAPADKEMEELEPTTKYAESPMLAAMVQAGELPSVDERLPPEPAVREPFEMIGKHGGTLQVFAGGPDPWQDFGALGANGPVFMRKLPDGEIIGDIMTDYQWGEDYKSITFTFRDGIRWSDGHPASVDDVLFCYNDMHAHPDVQIWSWLGDVDQVVKIDDRTVRWDFPTPRPAAFNHFVGVMGGVWMGIHPKHYLQKWHITYNSDADKLAKEAGYEHWYELFYEHYWWNPLRDLEKPTLQAWTLEEAESTHKLFERNPYYHWVDTAGNQLPYIDKILSQIVDPEVYQLKIISGESDMAYMFTTFDNYTLYKENEASGDYTTYAIPGLLSSEMAVYLNHNVPDPDKRQLFNTPKFKQALSLAIDREELNNLVFFGQGRTMQATIQPKYPWVKDGWYASYAEYDPERANRLLDEAGLTGRDKAGYRLGPSGKSMQIVIEARTQDIGSGSKRLLELVQEYWKEVGVNTMMKLIEGALFSERSEQGVQDARGVPVEIPVQFAVSSADGGYWCPLWHQWMDAQHDIDIGEAVLEDFPGGQMPGEEPPGWIKEYDSWYHTARQFPDTSPEYGEYMSKLLDMQAEQLFVIGTVGLVPQIITAKNYIANVPPKFAPQHVWAGALSEWCDQIAIMK